MKGIPSGLRLRMGSRAGGALLDTLLATVRYTESGAEHYQRFWRAGKPVVFVLWHGRLLPLTHFRRHRGIVAMISHHRDGEYITRVAEGWGYRAVRGSSSRGAAAALRGLVRAVRSGRSAAVTTDGPRGPCERIKPGILTLAQRSGAPLIPVSAGADRAWRLDSWDRFLVPKPFSRVRIVVGEPLGVPAQVAGEELERFAAELQRRMDEVTAEADREW